MLLAPEFQDENAPPPTHTPAQALNTTYDGLKRTPPASGKRLCLKVLRDSTNARSRNILDEGVSVTNDAHVKPAGYAKTPVPTPSHLQPLQQTSGDQLVRRLSFPAKAGAERSRRSATKRRLTSLNEPQLLAVKRQACTSPSATLPPQPQPLHPLRQPAIIPASASLNPAHVRSVPGQKKERLSANGPLVVHSKGLPLPSPTAPLLSPTSVHLSLVPAKSSNNGNVHTRRGSLLRPKPQAKARRSSMVLRRSHDHSLSLLAPSMYVLYDWLYQLSSYW